MQLIQSIVLGTIQGIAEFLPISSSAHLVLVPWLLGWDYKGLGFDVALHFGTAIAVVAYFWHDWVAIFRDAFGNNSQTRFSPFPKNILWQIILATIPAGIAGYLLSDHVDQWFHSPLLLAINLAVFGLILWLVDKKAQESLTLGEITSKKSLTVGLAQCLALVPGVSRSGITILTSRALGLKRADAARFSFLLGTPAVLGAFALEFMKMDHSAINFYFILSVAVTTIVGYFTIKYLLDFLTRKDMSIFAFYRFALAALIIILYIFTRTH